MAAVWANSASAGKRSNDSAGQRDVYFIRIYSLLTIVSLVAFGLLHILVETNPFLGTLEIGCGIVALANLLVLRITHNANVARFGLLATMLASLVVLLATGGIQGTGIFWSFTFPVAAFFLAGTWGGIVWVAAFALIIGGLVVLAQLGTAVLPYSLVDIRQMLAILLVITIGVFTHQRTRERSEKENQDSRLTLRQEQVKADAILENVGEGVIATDQEGKLVLANKAAEDLLGKESKYLIGQNFVDVVPMRDHNGEKVASDKRPLDRILQKGERASFMTTYIRPDGTSSYIIVIGTPIIVDGNIVGAIGSFRDVTEEQRLDRAKSQFVTLASHQLRTPISAIGWFAEMLLAGDAGAITDEQKLHMQQIYDSNQRLASMVDSMLIVSSIELGELAITLEDTNISKICHKLLEEQRKKHPEKDLHIQEQYDKSLPTMALDVKLASIILQNLISNAIKYTSSGGTISVSIAPNDEKLNSYSKGSVLIKVSDTGYGIAQHQQKDIFNKLFRADNIAIKDTDGTGLGLYIVRSLLQQLGGKIWFESTEGKGSTFFVLLPVEGMRPQSV